MTSTRPTTNNPTTPSLGERATRQLVDGLLWALAGAAVVGGVFLVVSQPQKPEITITLPTPTTPGPVSVYLTGEVTSPGLYTLDPGSRVADLLEAAQGSLPAADLEAVNLARALTDGEHIRIPRQEEVQVQNPSPGPTSVKETVTNVNTATEAELRALPGIGEVKASAIVEYRRANGPFQRLDELLKVDGIGPATYAGLKDLVTVGGA